MGLRPREGQTADRTQERSKGDDAFRAHLEMSLIRPVERLNREGKERKS